MLSITRQPNKIKFVLAAQKHLGARDHLLSGLQNFLKGLHLLPPLLLVPSGLLRPAAVLAALRYTGVVAAAVTFTGGSFGRGRGRWLFPVGLGLGTVHELTNHHVFSAKKNTVKN